jgi:hypothetical protein
MVKQRERVYLYSKFVLINNCQNVVKLEDLSKCQT